MRPTFAVVTLLCLAACGPSSKSKRKDDEIKGSYGYDPMLGKLITDIAGTGARFDVPAHANDAGTVTWDVYSAYDGTPEKDRVLSKVYEMGPTGLTFSPTATFTIPLPADAGSDAVIATAELSDAKWTELATTRSGTSLSAPVAHFSLFAVIRGTAVPDAGTPINCDSAGAITGTCTRALTGDHTCTELHGNLSDSQSNCLGAGGTWSATATPCDHTNVSNRCLFQFSGSCQLGFSYTDGLATMSSKIRCQAASGTWADGPP